MPNEVGELPPHPLDSAFEDCSRRHRVDRGLENNQCYQDALEASVRAFEGASHRPKGEVGPSAKRAARQAFLNAINGGSGASGSAG